MVSCVHGKRDDMDGIEKADALWQKGEEWCERGDEIRAYPEIGRSRARDAGRAEHGGRLK